MIALWEGLWETPSRLLQRAGLNVELKVVSGAETWRCGRSWVQAMGEKWRGMGTIIKPTTSLSPFYDHLPLEILNSTGDKMLLAGVDFSHYPALSALSFHYWLQA